MKTPNPLAKLFGKSPFGPIQEHMRIVESCAQQMLPLFEAVATFDREAVERIKQQVFELEDEADRVKNEIRSNLPKGLFMPVDRRDLLDLLHAQDSIADSAQDVAGLVVMRQMEFPDCIRDGFATFVQSAIDTVKVCRQTIHELDELLELGFRGRAADHVEKLVTTLGETETINDDHGMALCTQLFAHEDGLKPLTVIYWHHTIDLIGDIADYAEDVGDRLRLLIAR